MHPTDRVILRLIKNPRQEPQAGDRASIQTRLATAPFSRETHTAAEWSRLGTDVVGAPHPSRPGEIITNDTRLDACEIHVAKRIQDERWVRGTTPADYVADLHAASGHVDARLHVGERPPPDPGTRRGQSVAATLTHMGAPGLTLQKTVRNTGFALFVVYDAGKSCLVTGYSEPEYVVLNLVKRWNNRRVIAKGA